VVSRQRPRSTRLLVVALVAVSLAVITLDYREGQSGPLAGLGRDALTAIVPMQRAVTDVTRPIGNFFSGLAHLPSLQSENENLHNQVAALHSQLQTLAQERAQYTELLGLVQLKQSLAPDAVTALVVGNSLTNFEWTATIDKGSADGVAINAPVVAGNATGGILVGHIVDVAAHASRLQFIIDRSSTVAGVLGTSHQAGLVVGEGDEDMKMTLVSPDAQIAGNEQVFTQGICLAGQSGLYPPDILIGQVSRTLPSTNAIQATVDVRPAADFANLQFVLVLKSRTTC
jgi:rod shape-determining protein MreC